MCDVSICHISFITAYFLCHVNPPAKEIVEYVCEWCNKNAVLEHACMLSHKNVLYIHVVTDKFISPLFFCTSEYGNAGEFLCEYVEALVPWIHDCHKCSVWHKTTLNYIVSTDVCSASGNCSCTYRCKYRNKSYTIKFISLIARRGFEVVRIKSQVTFAINK